MSNVRYTGEETIKLKLVKNKDGSSSYIPVRGAEDEPKKDEPKKSAPSRSRNRGNDDDDKPKARKRASSSSSPREKDNGGGVQKANLSPTPRGDKALEGIREQFFADFNFDDFSVDNYQPGQFGNPNAFEKTQMLMERYYGAPYVCPAGALTVGYGVTGVVAENPKTGNEEYMNLRTLINRGVKIEHNGVEVDFGKLDYSKKLNRGNSLSPKEAYALLQYKIEEKLDVAKEIFSGTAAYNGKQVNVDLTKASGKVQAAVCSFVYNMKEESIGDGIRGVVADNDSRHAQIPAKLMEYRNRGTGFEAGLRNRRTIEGHIATGDYAEAAKFLGRHWSNNMVAEVSRGAVDLNFRRDDTQLWASLDKISLYQDAVQTNQGNLSVNIETGQLAEASLSRDNNEFLPGNAADEVNLEALLARNDEINRALSGSYVVPNIKVDYTAEERLAMAEMDLSPKSIGIPFTDPAGAPVQAASEPPPLVAENATPMVPLPEDIQLPPETEPVPDEKEIILAANAPVQPATEPVGQPATPETQLADAGQVPPAVPPQDKVEQMVSKAPVVILAKMNAEVKPADKSDDAELTIKYCGKDLDIKETLAETRLVLDRKRAGTKRTEEAAAVQGFFKSYDIDLTDIRDSELGYYGPKTEAAVVAFQKATGIGVDGKVGGETRAKFIEAIDNPEVMTAAMQHKDFKQFMAMNEVTNSLEGSGVKIKEDNAALADSSIRNNNLVVDNNRKPDKGSELVLPS